MTELYDPAQPNQCFENATLFFGAHANYARMGEMVMQVTNLNLPIGLVNTGQHWDRSFIGEGFGNGVIATNLDTRTSDSDCIREAAKAHLAYTGSDCVIVYGDTASALGPARAALDLGLPIIHLEGGFRTYDASGNRILSALPEEQIRREIDEIADVIVPLIPSAAAALQAEQSEGRIAGLITPPTGHPLADPIIAARSTFLATKPDPNLGIVTIHRKANLSQESGTETGLAQVLGQIGSLRHIEWAFPTYPATLKLIESAKIKIPSNVKLTSPLGHKEMLGLVAHAGIVVSDSAGLQVEAALAGRRIVIPRDETEYPDLVGQAVRLTRLDDVANSVQEVLAAPTLSIEQLDALHDIFGGGNAAANLTRVIAGIVALPAPVR